MQFKVKMLSYITQTRQGRNYGDPLVVTGSIALTWMGRKYGERTQTNIKHNKHSQENFEQFIPAPPPGKSRGVYTRPAPPPGESPPPPGEYWGVYTCPPSPRESQGACNCPTTTGESRGVYTCPPPPPSHRRISRSVYPSLRPSMHTKIKKSLR